MRRAVVEVQAGAVMGAGPYVRGEARWRPAPRHSMYGFAEWSPARSMVGAGWRYDW